MTTTLEDLRIAALQGDATALNQLCREVTQPVFRLCLRMLGHIGDAEDCTQDILIKVVTHLSQFAGESAFMSWVHTIAVRHVLATKRSRAELRPVDEASFAALLDMGLAYGASAAAPSAEDRMLVREIRVSCTQAMLLVLNRDERMAIVLVDLLGLDAAEAGAALETSHDALRQRLTRARARLCAFLEAKCGVANPAAACRCEKQVPAKRAVGAKVKLLPLCSSDRLTVSPDVDVAREELRQLRVIADTFHAEGLFAAPDALVARVRSLLPSVL